MIQEYPKMVYKSKKDYKIANSLEDEEKLANDGYGRSEIVLRGKKPEEIKAEEPKAEEPKPKRKRRTQAEMEEARKLEEVKK